MIFNSYPAEGSTTTQSLVAFSLWDVLIGSGLIAAFAMFAISRIYDRYRQRRALASALRAELGLISHRFTFIRQAKDRKASIERMHELKRTDDWAACTQIYIGNVGNLEKLPFDLIKDLATLYANVLRFARMSEDSLFRIRPDGSCKADDLVGQTCSLIVTVGRPLEYTSWAWYKRPFHSWHTKKELRRHQRQQQRPRDQTTGAANGLRE